MNGLKNLSHRLNHIALGFVLALLLLLGINYWITYATQEEGMHINLLGRQSMLTQRMHRLLLQLNEQPPNAAATQQHLQELGQAVAFFNDTLLAFAQGGLTHTSEGLAVALFPDPDPVCQLLLRQAVPLWQNYASLLVLVTAHTQPDPNQVSQAHAFASQHSDQLQDLMERLAWQHIHTDQVNSSRLIGLEVVSIALILGLLGWGWVLQYRLNRLKQLEFETLKTQLDSKTSEVVVVKQQVDNIIETSPDLVWVKDLNGIYVSCNLPFANHMRATQAQIIGKTDFDLVKAQEAERVRAHDRLIVTGRKPLTIEEWHQSVQGGEPSLFEIIKSPVYEAGGKLTGLQCIGRDITLRRAAQSAYKETEAQRRMLELCVAKITDAVVITEIISFEEPHPRIVFVNDAFERMTGYSRAEALGKSPKYLLQSANTQHNELERMSQDLAQWQPVHAELIFRKKNGEESWTEIDIVQVASDMGWFRISVQRDISARKAADAEMLAMIDHAREASRLKSEFLSSISHEMRTPMNAVIGMANLLLDTQLDPQQATYANYIASAGQDYMQVIEKALDFSQLESGALAMDSLPFELQPMLKSIELLTRPKTDAKKLTLLITQDANLPAKLMGDERRLRQCLLLLLENALKFTSKGGISLAAAAVQWEGQAPAVRFEVTDTGIGLTESDRSRLFHSFVQGDGSMTRRYGGIGLGLVICRQLVELMQGRIGVDSEPGKGSSFWLELPLKAA